MGKFLGGLLMLVAWGFCLGLGLWMWNQVADRWVNPKVDAFFEKRQGTKWPQN